MSNSFYVASLAPATGSQGSSAVMRAEFAAIEGGFDLMPTLSSVPYHVVHVNAGSSALTTTSGFSFDGSTLSVPGVIVGSGGMAITGNITLATYYISYDGTDAGISIDASQNVTLSAGLSVNGNTTLGDASGDTLTINAGTWTIGSNYTATRAVGAAAAGASTLRQDAFTYTGDSGGTTQIVGEALVLTGSGSNAISLSEGIRVTVSHSGSATATTVIGGRFLGVAGSTGNVTNLYGLIAEVRSTAANTVTTGRSLYVSAPTMSGGGSITEIRGLEISNIGNSSIATARGIFINDFTNSTNMRGIQSSLSSGSNKYNLYIDGTAQNYIAGTLTIGTTNENALKLTTSATASSTSAAEYGTYNALSVSNTSGAHNKVAVGTFLSVGSGYAGTNALYVNLAQTNHAQAVTAYYRSYGAYLNASAAGTISAWTGLHVISATNSGGATVTTFAGVYIAPQTVGTNIYGIQSQIAAASGRYNLYIDGTAQNYIAGNTGIGATPVGYYQLYINGTLSSDGASTVAAGTRFATQVVGATGDTGWLTQASIGGSIVTQGATETVSVVAGLYAAEPSITVGSGDTVTTAATVYIANAPTEGSTNAALYVASGASYFLGAAHATAGLTVGATSGVLTFPDGTVSQPGARVGTSSTTGLFSSADNSVRIANNQVESLTTVAVSNGVTVGIGQPSPTTAANKVYLHIGDGDTTTVNQEARLRLQTGNAAGGARTWDAYSNVSDYTFTVEDTSATGYGFKVRYSDGSGAAGALYPITDSLADLGAAGSIAWRTLYVDRIHAGGLTQLDYIQHRIIGNFTSGGASNYGYQLQVSGTLTLASGDTGNSGGTLFNTGTTTQGASETINLISTVYIAEPLITVGTGDTVTSACCLYVDAAPTEAANNWSAIIAGRIYFGGPLNIGGSASRGVESTSYSLGTKSSGTVTPNPQDSPFQHYTNGGAHTLAPSGNTGSIIVDITNNGSAGAITTSSFTQVSGDSFTTTNGHKFRCSITIGNGGSLLAVTALQ